MLNWKQGINPYTVSTPVFEGPFDLLLSLIEKAELDITRLSLAIVTDKFLAEVRAMRVEGAENVSGFLIIAAKLLQIKSEALLPRKTEISDLLEDPAEDLARQLLEYKQYKEKSAFLEDRLLGERRTFIRINPQVNVNVTADLTGLTANDLAIFFKQTFRTKKFDAPVARLVSPIRVTIREKIDSIIFKLKNARTIGFLKLVGSAKNENNVRTHVVVSFLALLELVKRRIVQAEQTHPFDEITISPSEGWSDTVEIDNLEFGDA